MQKMMVDEMKAVKVEQSIQILLFVLVDSTKHTAEMLICGSKERNLAEQAFGTKCDGEQL
jgi:inorganic pyrophosphatase/exopolyphosphatase